MRKINQPLFSLYNSLLRSDLCFTCSLMIKLDCTDRNQTKPSRPVSKTQRVHVSTFICRPAWDRGQLLTHLRQLKQGCGLDMWPGTLSHKSLCPALPVSHYRSWWGGFSHSPRCLWPFSARTHFTGKWARRSLTLLHEGQSHLHILYVRINVK